MRPAPERTFENLGSAVAIPQSLPVYAPTLLPSPDGLLVVVLGRDANAQAEESLEPRIVDLDRGVVVATVQGHRHPPSEGKWFAGGRWLITWGSDFVVTDGITGAMIRRFDWHEDGAIIVSDRGARSPAVVALREDRSSGAGATERYAARVIDAATGEVFELQDVPHFSNAAVSPTEPVVVFQNDGNLRAVHQDGTVLFDVALELERPWRLRFSADGAYVSVEDGDHEAAIVFEVRTGIVRERLGGEVVWHPSRPELLVREASAIVHVDLTAGERSSVPFHGTVVDLEFEPATGAHLVLDDTGRLSGRSTPREPFGTMTTFDARGRSCGLAFESGLVSRAVCTRWSTMQGAAIVLANGEERLAKLGEDDLARPIAEALPSRPATTIFRCRSHSVLVGDGTARAIRTPEAADSVVHHDPRTGVTLVMRGSELVRINTDNRRAWSVAFGGSSDGIELHPSRPLIALRETARQNFSFEVRDFATGELVRRLAFSEKERPIHSVTFHPQEDVVAVGRAHGTEGGEEDATVVLFDVRTGRQLATLDDARTVQFSADGSRVLTSNRGSALWSTKPYRRVAVFWQNDVFFAFGDELIGLRRLDESVYAKRSRIGLRFADAKTGAIVHELETGPIGADAHARVGDGRLVFTLDEADSSYARELDLHVWNVAGEKRVATYPAESTDAILSVLGEGAVVVTAAQDRVRFHRMKDGANLFVHAVDGVESCRPVVFDPSGAFEGEPADAAKVVRYRLGSDLRRAKIVSPSDPEGAAFRTTNALATFLQQAGGPTP